MFSLRLLEIPRMLLCSPLPRLPLPWTLVPLTSPGIFLSCLPGLELSILTAMTLLSGTLVGGAFAVGAEPSKGTF